MASGPSECHERVTQPACQRRPRGAAEGRIFGRYIKDGRYARPAQLLAIWNRDYLSGTGGEPWGVFKLDGAFALKGEPAISQQVFERIVYVMNQRLQGLVLESELIHRTWPNGSHTCIAGRGVEIRQYSIVYFEGAAGYGSLTSRAILVVGPAHDFDRLQTAIESEIRNFVPLVGLANSLIDLQRRRPLLDAPAFPALREALAPDQEQREKFSDVTVTTEYRQKGASAYETLHWDYFTWLESGSLSEAQRRVLTSEALRRHPVRVIGPAGSGKTLLMQLLALRHLHKAHTDGQNIKVLYLVHNAPMAQTVGDRFRALGGEEFLTSPEQSLTVTTLAEHSRQLIGLSETMVIDKDAQKTKLFQYEQVQEAFRAALNANQKVVDGSPLLSQISRDNELFELVALLVMAEISTVIKGRGLMEDEQRYTNSDIPLSRFHGILNPGERRVIFDCFKRYHHFIFETYEMLDADDIALSLAGRLRTPVWKLKRKTEGFDFVFVDEAQLFNENERRVLPFLTKDMTPHVPIALALDEAQEPFGFAAAGLATLGIPNIENEELPSNHRSTREIVDLAFFVIQRTTDLFGSDFPDFTKNGTAAISSTSPQAEPPRIIRYLGKEQKFGDFVVRLVQELRAKNVRQIAVVCHAEAYWNEVMERLDKATPALPLHVIAQRGEKLSPDQPLVVLSRPAHIGGQEFDAVLLLGLEEGLVPPRVPDNPPLAAALEQQTLREIYLSVTRAKFRVIFVLNRGASPHLTIQEAKSAGLVS
jgi:superfamily I DNA/RNA helicase